MFELPTLPYAYNALEPVIDAETMHLHHDKHHQAYVTKLNEALANHPELAEKPIQELLGNLSALPDEIRTAVRNHGGGHFNHSLFWVTMTPSASSQPTGMLTEALKRDFGGVEEFQKQFVAAGLKHFGSGWVWLVKNASGTLSIISTANQDTPHSEGLTPLLGNDLWEHAYYLKYNNRRQDYLEAWWGIVNWDEVATRLA